MSALERHQSAVYTVLLGGYETLNDAQNVGDGSVDFICYTDDPSLTSEVWTIRQVTPLFARDLQRSQREVKIRGCVDLERYDRTLYIDNSVSLTAAPETILDVWLAQYDIAVPQHSFRSTVLDEFMTVIEVGLDEPARVYEQLYHYTENSPAILDETPLWNGLIARRNTPNVRAAMSRWFDEVLRYSRRDQLSANVILGASDVRLNRVELDNHSSAVHRWPAPVARINTVMRQAQTRIAPDVARIRELESMLAREVDLAADKERQLAEMRATRSWRVARRISDWSAALRPQRTTAQKQKQKQKDQT